MAEDRSKLSNLGDVVGGLAALGTAVAGTAVAVNGINTLETLPPKTAPITAEVQESPADQKRKEAWREIAAGGASVLIGAGGLGVVLAGRRETAPAPKPAEQKVWGAPVDAEIPRAPGPQHQEFAKRFGTADERRAQQGHQQQQQ